MSRPLALRDFWLMGDRGWGPGCVQGALLMPPRVGPGLNALGYVGVSPEREQANGLRKSCAERKE